MRVDQLRYAVRRIPWRQLAGALTLCTLLLIATAHRVASTTELLPLLRIATLTLACVSTSALHDPSATVTETTAAGRLRLRLIAAPLTFVAVAAAWFVVIVAFTLVTGVSVDSIASGLSLELTTMFATGLAIAAAAPSMTSSGLMPAWSAATLVSVTATTVVDAHTRGWLWTEPGLEWHRSHVRWAWVAVAAVGLFVAVSRDPARRNHRAVNRRGGPARQRAQAPL